MASHVAHLLFGEQCAGRVRLSLDRRDPFFVLGAQGPDLFLHSQRTKPRAIQYGALLHRKGFARLASLLSSDADSQVRRYAAGFITHIVLDRYSHPFINYFAGWWDRTRPETRRYRYMHPFLERLIDIELLRREEARHPREIDFARLIDCGEEIPELLLRALEEALPRCLESAGRDAELVERLRNAYRDALGYYRFTSTADDAYLREAIRREAAGRISERWLSLIHPPSLPYDLDVLNTEHRWWTHPCDNARRSEESFLDLWERALEEGARLLERYVEVAEVDGSAEVGSLEDAIGEENLNDGIYRARPCPKREMDPLPLPELYEAIKETALA